MYQVKKGGGLNDEIDTSKAGRSLQSDGSRHPLETRYALPMALLRARESVMSHFRPMLSAHGLSEQQWRVMRVLDEAGSLDATEVAKRSAISTPSLSRIIKTLEKQGALVRERNVEDARRAHVYLTDHGSRTVRQLTPESLEIYAGLEEQLGTHRVAALITMLNELIDME